MESYRIFTFPFLDNDLFLDAGDAAPPPWNALDLGEPIGDDTILGAGDDNVSGALVSIKFCGGGVGGGVGFRKGSGSSSRIMTPSDKTIERSIFEESGESVDDVRCSTIRPLFDRTVERSISESQ